MIKSGNFTIIPMGAACAVFEDLEDGTFKIVGDHGFQSQEESLNKMRQAVSVMMENERRQLDRHTRSWKIFQASKEFLSPEQLELAEEAWKTFDFEKFQEESAVYSAAYNAAMIDITDFMLDKNITLKSLEDNSDIDVVSVESVKNILGKFGG